MNPKKLIITIDGPAGSGKSTTAKSLSKNLGYIYLDTGAMYRAIALYVLNQNIDPENTEKVVRSLSDIHIELKYNNQQQQTYLNGFDVSDAIRSPEVTKAVSPVSAMKDVRTFLVRQQQLIAKDGGYIVDGRDAGTVIFPGADIKFFLTAAVEERARRRMKDLELQHIQVSIGDMIAEINRRDQYDQNRAESPLRKAEGAIEIDNTHLPLDEQVELMKSYIIRLT
jgi:cytidylate kinase